MQTQTHMQTPRHLTWVFFFVPCSKGGNYKGIAWLQDPRSAGLDAGYEGWCESIDGHFSSLQPFVSYQSNGSILSRWRNREQRKYSAMICVTQCTLCVVMEHEMKIMNCKSLIRVMAIWSHGCFHLVAGIFFNDILVKTCPVIKYIIVETHFRIWNAFETSHSCWYYHTQKKLKGISKVHLICIM